MPKHRRTKKQTHRKMESIFAGSIMRALKAKTTALRVKLQDDLASLNRHGMLSNDEVEAVHHVMRVVDSFPR